METDLTDWEAMAEESLEKAREDVTAQNRMEFNLASAIVYALLEMALQTRLSDNS